MRICATCSTRYVHQGQNRLGNGDRPETCWGVDPRRFGDYVTRAYLVKKNEEAMERGFSHRLVTLEVYDATDADPLGNNPVFSGGTLVGRATGGSYGFRVEKSLALAMVGSDLAGVGTELEIDILGAMHRATVIDESPYDPGNEKLRG